MSAPGFWRQAGFGFLLSACGAILFAALGSFVGHAALLRFLVAGLGALYLALLLHDLRARIGVVVTIACWLAVTLLLFALQPGLWAWLLAQVAMIWLVRCLYRYDSLGSAVADAALSGFAVATAIATAGYTRSMFLTLWSFFLVQSLFVFIPGTRTSATGAAAASDPEDAFGHAHRNAETALRRLATRT